MKDAAEGCFAAIRTGGPVPENYRFNRFSHSVLLTALRDFGCDPEQLTAPLSVVRLDRLFSETMGSGWTCNMDQAWLRKKFAPHRVPDSDYRKQDWHQDGALGVRSPLEPGPAIPMTRLLTCWIPLTPCGRDSPGLEFVRRPQPVLLHFTELDDAVLRRRFSPEDFWAPELEPGDGLVFLNGTLHRTDARPEMRHDRISVEYRIFPAVNP